MKKRVGLYMLLSSLFLCSQTVHADVVLGPPGLGADAALALGLAPFVVAIVVVTAIIIKKMKNRK